MKVILIKYAHVTKDGETYDFDEFECDIPDGLTDPDEIYEAAIKYVEEYIEKEKTK